MDWLNENSGVLVLIFSIIIIVLSALCVWLLFNLHSKIATQKLKFAGFYSVNRDAKKRYASLTIGNKSINDMIINEIGIQNGKVNFPLTDVYRRRNSLTQNARITIEQRNSLNLELLCEELRQFVLEKNGKTILQTLRIYAIDMTGTTYSGKISTVRKLMVEMLKAEKNGTSTSAFAMVNIPEIVSDAPATVVADEVAPTYEAVITQAAENAEQEQNVEE